MPKFEKPSVADLRHAAEALGMNPSMDYLNAVQDIIAPLCAAYAALDDVPDETPAVKYPRDGGRKPSPEENKLGAWYVKTAIKGKPGGKLAGRRVALKDNVCLAGVPMMVGAGFLVGTVPDIDATIVTRILDEGGEIAGKAVCEFYCVSGGSHTSSTGPVQNRGSTATPPAARRQAAPRWSRPARCRWQSAAIRPVRSAFRPASAASSA
jgi:amidase